MRFTSTLAAGALALGASANSNYLGFNSGATLPDYQAKFKADFEAEFKAAQGLEGAPGKFNAVRLYTNIQAYSKYDPIQAFEAAMDTDTHMLLGVWTSSTSSIDREMSALKKAVSKHGTRFTDLVIGISIGSEDLYRDSATGKAKKGGVGNSPDAIVRFIKDFKKAFADGPLSKVPVGHVDTWDAWTNSTNKAVIDAIDWLGVDEYPCYQNGEGNDIKNSGTLFDEAYDKTVAAANGKPVWVTETGWPVTGPDWDQAVPNIENAKYYWNEVGCRKLFNKTPTFWYTLRDSNPGNKLKFGITKDLSTKPLFSLTCPTSFDTKPKSSSASSKRASSTTSEPASTGSHSTGMAAATSASGSGSKNSGSESSPDAASGAPAAKPTSGAGAVCGLSATTSLGFAVIAGALALF